MARKIRPITEAPEIRAALLAAKWAQQIGLPPGNYWEPAVARHIISDYQRLGGTADVWPAVEGIYTARLGLS